jgi:hypothetical protein
MGPGAPTSVSAEAGNASATVSFTAPTFTGVPPGITGYLVTSSPGGVTATGAASPITVTGLTNGTAYTFSVQATNGVQYGPAGTSGSATPGVRGIFGGGATSGFTTSNIIDYINIGSTGNATDFGDLTQARYELAACSSSTRGVFGGGDTGLNQNTMDYITISSAGNATDFGDLTGGSSPYTVRALSACSSSTRGVFGGGLNAGQTINALQYITIATTGNSTDFGDLLTNTAKSFAACASPTRGIFAGGTNTVDTALNIIQYITIASTGNATDFGDLTQNTNALASCANSTRGLFAGGNTYTNVISYITIASVGNAIDFGDLGTATTYLAACSSDSRAVFGGGDDAVSFVSRMVYVTIDTTGNSSTFGDLTVARTRLSGCSNGHGGL